MIVYTIVAMKLLSFIPDNIHVVRRKIQAHEIIAEDHSEHFHLFPLDGPVASDTIEEDISVTQTEKPKPILDKEARKNEKIAGLVTKWIESEHYTQPEINIKDVATDMGTNSNYLSTYLNKVLDTSFATWLNTLRIEKSKEYLCSESKLSIEECGTKVGYNSLYNYSRWFKAVTGMSPSLWRKTHN
jgi:YesN/AraC family two-component response regulator